MSEEDFVKFYDEYADAIFRHCFFRVRNRELAVELSQETFLRIWEYISRGKMIENPRAFLYKVANNRIIDESRKKRDGVSLEVLNEEEGFEPVGSDGEELMNFSDGRIALERIKELPDIYRSVIIMRFLDDLAISEIADIARESENVISVRIHRALKMLKNLFHADG